MQGKMMEKATIRICGYRELLRSGRAVGSPAEDRVLAVSVLLPMAIEVYRHRLSMRADINP
jgi:hypothetical protein